MTNNVARVAHIDEVRKSPESFTPGLLDAMNASWCEWAVQVWPGASTFRTKEAAETFAARLA